MQRWKKWVTVVVTIVTLFAGAKFAFDRYQLYEYPYGRSHCCDTGVGVSLFGYAERHDGWYPRGEATPEASLSLLYRETPRSMDANTLRGKSVPEADVQARLDAGELLTPETCGWHYVEGLRSNDGSHLALFWDKAGLDHNGGRLPGGGHIVNFISGEREHVTADRWEEFLAKQQQLRAALKR